MVKLKSVLFDFWKNGSFLLINKFLLFLKTVLFDSLFNTHKIDRQIPRDAWE